MPSPALLDKAATVLNEAETVTMLVGAGGRTARDEVLAVADTLAAPMVLTLKGKEGLEQDNPFQVEQTGLLGNGPRSTRWTTVTSC
jgi:pyruvate dehydrogenase (quinone)